MLALDEPRFVWVSPNRPGGASLDHLRAMRIEQLDHVALHVHDLARSVRFYHKVLGLPQIERPAFDFPGAWFGIGERHELHLIARAPTNDPDEAASRFSVPRERHFAMTIPDPDAAAAHLRDHGIEFTGPKPRPDGARQIFLRDPDGHVIELCAPPGA